MSDPGMSENPDPEAGDAEVLKRERYELLHRLESLLEMPMIVLAFLWLVLLVLELLRGEGRLFYYLGLIIWAVFILDFAVKLILSPEKVVYLKGHWLTAMIITTMGSQYWPQTTEGRVLCLFLAMYAVGIFGCVTAALATFFVGRDADSIDAELAGAKQLAALRDEVGALRDEIRGLSRQPPEL